MGFHRIARKAIFTLSKSISLNCLIMDNVNTLYKPSSINTNNTQEMSTATLSILIVEDDLSFALELDMLVREIGYNVVGRVDNSAEALETILTESPDMILMDIDIKGKLTGIEIAEKITHLDIPVLFITSFAQETYYNQAKKTNFIGYLVKPINKYSLRSSLEMAIRSISNNRKEDANNMELQKDKSEETETFPLKEYLFFKKKGVFQKVKIQEILYLEANDDYCLIHTIAGSFIASQRLSQMEDLLDNYSFMRIHRSYLVNLNAITSIDTSDNLVFFKEKQVPYSRSKKDLLLEQINLIK